MSREVGTEDVSASGGSMLLVGHAGDGYTPARPMPDLAPLLAVLDPPDAAGSLAPAGAGPFLAPGQVLTWHFRDVTEVCRVVSDDERGLVCWLPGGSPRIGVVFDRDLPVDQRFHQERRLTLGTWKGYGVLRVAPTGKPWSYWAFFEDDGTFAGWYVNIEVPHARPAALAELAPGAVAPEELARTHTRDLVLDLWMGPDGEIWFKDQDELAECERIGRFSPEVVALVRELGEHARAELDAGTAWPLGAGFEDFAPSAELTAPVELPDNPMVRYALEQIEHRA